MRHVSIQIARLALESALKGALQRLGCVGPCWSSLFGPSDSILQSFQSLHPAQRSELVPARSTAKHFRLFGTPFRCDALMRKALVATSEIRMSDLMIGEQEPSDQASGFSLLEFVYPVVRRPLAMALTTRRSCSVVSESISLKARCFSRSAIWRRWSCFSKDSRFFIV